jgi:hypothetical protein
VEKQVWRMLFQMVEGRDLDSLLLELVGFIPWNALAALESDRQWFSFSTDSSQTAPTTLQQMTSSLALPQAQEGAPTNMDMSGDFEDSSRTTNQPSADGGEPMDTRLDGESDLTVKDCPVPASGQDDDVRRRKQDLDGDKSGDGVVDEQEQQLESNHVDETVPPTRSRPDSVVQPSKTSHLEGTKGTKNGLVNKQRRRGNKNRMPSSKPSGKTPLGSLLAAGESYSMPIDVEAVDMLIRNFPITEEHQVRHAGVDFLKPYAILF